MKTYPLTPSGFDALKAKLAESGVILTPGSSSSVISYQGIRLAWAYDGAATLTLKILEKPFLVPTSMIWDQVDKWIQG
jgi:hypothetical protein